MESDSGAARREETAFAVTFVCTGNRARSPIAAALLRRLVAGRNVSVDSVGTLDLGPLPALPEAYEAAAQLGLDLGTHRARSFRGGALQPVDLVVGFEPTHVATAVVDGGVPRERCFAIVELAQLLEAGPATVGTAPADVVLAAHARRVGSPLSAPSIADPLGGTQADFRQMVETVDRLVAVIAWQLFGVPIQARPTSEPESGLRALVGRLRSGRVR